MGLFVGSDSIAPRFLRAANAAALTKLILKEQRIRRKEYKFISFYQASDGYHYAWYYEENDLQTEIMDKLNKERK